MDSSSQNGPGGVNTSGKSYMSRAELFEYEKKRIIDSCFSKREDGGSVSESYITHLRMEEDANYPSTPPPPTTSLESKKPRIIIVAVRKTGRVRVHKARENANGTFSIGKTWLLDDLVAVQSYTGATPAGPDEEMYKQWAGSAGFTVTLNKPYYWKANSQKEKLFFIASLIKIYYKYTGGNLPELIGFDQREREQLPGAAARPPPTIRQSGTPTSASSQLPSRDPTREAPYQSDGDTGSASTSFPNGVPSINKPPPRQPRRSLTGTVDSNLQMPGSPRVKPQFRRLATDLGQQTNQQAFSQGDSGASFSPQSREARNIPGRLQNSGMQSDQRPSPPDGGILSERFRKNSLSDLRPMPAPLSLPTETRRPSISNSNNSRERLPGLSDISVPAPLSSPAKRREDKALTRTDISNKSNNIDTTLSSQAPEIETPSKPSFPTSSFSNTPKSEDAGYSDDSRQGSGFFTNSFSKSEVSSVFSGASNALNSFKPRAGGAVDRLKDSFKDFKSKSSDDSSITANIIPPSNLLRLPGSTSLPIVSLKVPDTTLMEENATPESERSMQSDQKNTSASLDASSESLKPHETKKNKSPIERVSKELSSIGVDPLTLSGRGGDLVSAWDQFGWVGEGIRSKNIDQMKDEVEREICRIQADGWLSRLEEEDERIDAIKMGFDNVIEECEELDGLLTLYLVELGTLNEDVAYIEAQSQGLQVQTANQKLLKAELESLLQTISISPDQIDSLRESSLESARGLTDIEKSLVILFKAMLTIDPSLGVSRPRHSEDVSLISGKPGGYGNSEIGSMRVLQEKKDVYRNEISIFLRRLKPFLQVKFATAFDLTRQAIEREKMNNLAIATRRAKLDSTKHDLARVVLWKYSPLMLFTREVDRVEWENIMKMYKNTSMPLYQEEFREAVSAFKRAARKTNSDESEILFSSQNEKQSEGIATTARKLTVKKSQTLAKTLRSPISESNNRPTVDKMLGQEPFEVFEEAISKMVSIMSLEQNFYVEFFHVSSLEQLDFAETVATTSPDERRGVDLKKPRVMDPNRDLAMLVVQSMEEIFSFFPKDIQAFIDWSLEQDPLQGVGIIAALERKIPEFEETSQEYLNRTLQRLHTQLIGVFIKFLDEQIRGIEETKVKIKKRKGVIGFIKAFPSFSNALERKIVGAQDLEIRCTVDNAYSRINKAMFDALKVIARENPGVHIAGTDPADKEALNYEILLMQNMHHYLEEVDPRSNPVLEDWKQNAANEMDEHMNLYLATVMRRPLGKLLDFLESTESMMLSRQPGESISKISGMPSHSKLTFKKVLAGYDSKEIRRGIDSLKKRIDKHFGDEHDGGVVGGSSL
ncbi:hypothetical protein K3495_g12039, partial [Podosphaera aphanis]